MLKTIFTLLFFLFTSNSLTGRDFGSWKKDSIARTSWEYITKHKAELIERAGAVEKISGKKVDIQFIHNSKIPLG